MRKLTILFWMVMIVGIGYVFIDDKPTQTQVPAILEECYETWENDRSHFVCDYNLSGFNNPDSQRYIAAHGPYRQIAYNRQVVRSHGKDVGQTFYLDVPTKHGEIVSGILVFEMFWFCIIGMIVLIRCADGLD